MNKKILLTTISCLLLFAAYPMAKDYGNTVTVKVGNTETYQVQKLNGAKWQSANKKIVTVKNTAKNEITIKGIKAGKTKLKAKSNNQTYTINVKVTSHKHTWNKGKIIKKSTCKKQGIKKYTCTKCKATKKVKIPKKHNYVNFICTKCHKVQKNKIKKGYSYYVLDITIKNADGQNLSREVKINNDYRIIDGKARIKIYSKSEPNVKYTENENAIMKSNIIKTTKNKYTKIKTNTIKYELTIY